MVHFDVDGSSILPMLPMLVPNSIFYRVINKKIVFKKKLIKFTNYQLGNLTHKSVIHRPWNLGLDQRTLRQPDSV